MADNKITNNTTGHRRHPRYPFIANVLVDGKIIFKSMNLSKDGIYIYTGRSYTKGSILNISLPNGRDRVQIQARVVHDQPGIGMGLAFIKVEYDQKIFIEKLIAPLVSGQVARSVAV